MAFALTTLFALTISSARAGNVSPPYEVATWQGFRPAAVSFTFDDDLTNQYSKAVPMFNAKGFKMTLFTVTAWLPWGSWASVRSAAAAGHEIASHTVTHPHLNAVSETEVSNELVNSRLAIDANIPGQRCVTLAYPFCDMPADRALVSANYIAARGCSGQLVPATPPDFLNISSFVCGSLGLSGQGMNAKADAAVAANSWCVYLIHAVDNEKGYSPLPSADLQECLDHMSANPDKFWVQTFGNVVRYIRERNAVSVTENSTSDATLAVQVTDNLDDAVYNYPITLRRPLPADWPAATVSQKNRAITSLVTNIQATNYLVFDVVPNGGDVVISKASR